MKNYPEYPLSGQVSRRTFNGTVTLTYIGEDHTCLIVESNAEYFSATWTPRISCADSIKKIRKLGFLEGKEKDAFVELGNGMEFDTDCAEIIEKVESSSDTDIRFVRIDSETRSIVIASHPGDPRLCVSIGGEPESISFLQEAIHLTAKNKLKPIFIKMMELLR